MMKLSDEGTVVKLAILSFFVLSIVNLYYNIKLNRRLLEKQE